MAKNAWPSNDVEELLFAPHIRNGLSCSGGNDRGTEAFQRRVSIRTRCCLVAAAQRDRRRSRQIIKMRAVDENRAALGISQKKRVVLVIAHLGPGGAQRVVATAANALIELGLDVHVVQVLGEPADAYIVDLKVNRHRLASSSGRKRRSAFVEKYVEPIKRSVMKFDFVKRPVFAVAFSIEFRRRAKKLRRILMAIDPDAVLSFLTQTNILTLSRHTRVAGARRYLRAQ